MTEQFLTAIPIVSITLQFVLPEMIAHAFLTTTFLFSFQFIALILNAPLVAYNVNKIMQKQHMYDATEIFRTLGAHKKECFIKLGWVSDL